MAAHLYWRVNVTANNGSSAWSVNEIGMSYEGGASLTVGGIAIADVTNNGYVAANAFDGNDGTLYASMVPTGWIQYQFTAPVELFVVTLKARSDGYTGDMPKNFDIQWSDDGVAFTTDWSVAGATGWIADEQRTFTSPDIPAAGTALASALAAIVPMNNPAATDIRASALAAVIPAALAPAQITSRATALAAVIPIGLAPAAGRVSSVAIVVAAYCPPYVPPPKMFRLPCQTYCLPLYYMKETK